MASPAKAGGERHATDGQVPSDRVPAAASLYAKIAEVMAEVGYVAKRGRNDFHKYDYATEADVLDAVRDKLAARHVAVVPSLRSIDERPYETRQGKGSIITTARIAYTFLDGDSGESLTAEWGGQGDDPADKGLYKAMTGSEKYFLMKTFLISTGDDPEADRATDERDRAPAAPPPLTDPRAVQLRREAQTAFDALKAVDPSIVSEQRFKSWLDGQAHSHDGLERLGSYLREELKKAEGR